MKTELSLIIYEDAMKAIAASDEFIEKVTGYLKIDRATYHMYSWSIEDAFEGGDIRVVGSFEDLDEDQPADFSEGIPFGELYSEVTGDFADMVRKACKSWFLMSATREWVSIDASDGTLSWNERFASPEIEGELEKQRDKMDAFLQQADGSDKAIKFARWCWNASEAKEYDIQMSEQEAIEPA